MIAVVCNTFEQAKTDFFYFLSILQQMEPWTIERVWDSQYCVETDDNLRYIFIVNYMVPVFRELKADLIDVEDFFDGLEDNLYVSGLR